MMILIKPSTGLIYCMKYAVAALLPELRSEWYLLRLFECIGAVRGCGQMKKGSPRDYDAETGCLEQSAQKSQLGEPHECYPLYRIGRTQENHQLLHKDGSRPNCSRRKAGGFAVSASQVGGKQARNPGTDRTIPLPDRMIGVNPYTLSRTNKFPDHA